MSGETNLHTNETLENDASDGIDESNENVITRIMERHGLRQDECLELIDEVVAAFGGQGLEACEADGNPVKKLNSLHRNAWKFLIEYQANQKMADDVRISTRTMALVLGFKVAAGADSVTELSRMNNVEKQAVNKCALNFIRLLNLPPMDGQRTEQARKNMKQARINQIKKT